MVVNSLVFLLFFIVVFVVYYTPVIKQSATRQNIWLLLASYFFYGFVDWKMLPILFVVTVLFYWLGAQIKKEMDKNEKGKASCYMKSGVVIGIGLLLYFKYLNFFAESVAEMFKQLGVGVSWSTLNIVLPVGVSFFTFKLISYLIEIKRKKTQPAENLLEFATYISFFPTISSGPIDRPNTFLTQLRTNHCLVYDKAVDGCQQILWGIFTKVVVADNLATVTSQAWNDYQSMSSSFLILAILLSPIQVYADFDGYTNMAIGVSKILGFDVTKNFNHPLLARNVSEYWNRWHMSLTSWITDYVFTPLCLRFRDMANIGIMLAITANLIIIGLWHGANWTYAVFGIFHSILFIPIVYSGKLGKNKKLKEGKYGLPLFKDFIKMIQTYILVGIGQVIFFAKDTYSAFDYIKHLFTGPWHFECPIKLSIIVFILLLFVLEWTSRKKEYALQIHEKYKDRQIWKLFVIDYIILAIIIKFGCVEDSQFIYFQF
ncbi:MAG: MBOAT family protein [Paludibacteraceae bacterium]|nr:MBOAT family protein [Paludibacteraceae bacterium]